LGAALRLLQQLHTLDKAAQLRSAARKLRKSFNVFQVLIIDIIIHGI